MNKKSIEFHVKSQDYFGTLATIIDLVMQQLENSQNNKNAIIILNKIIKNLLYLQKNYKIIQNKSLKM